MRSEPAVFVRSMSRLRQASGTVPEGIFGMNGIEQDPNEPFRKVVLSALRQRCHRLDVFCPSLTSPVACYSTCPASFFFCNIMGAELLRAISISNHITNLYMIRRYASKNMEGA